MLEHNAVKSDGPVDTFCYHDRSFNLPLSPPETGRSEEVHARIPVLLVSHCLQFVVLAVTHCIRIFAIHSLYCDIIE